MRKLLSLVLLSSAACTSHYVYQTNVQVAPSSDASEPAEASSAHDAGLSPRDAAVTRLPDAAQSAQDAASSNEDAGHDAGFDKAEFIGAWVCQTMQTTDNLGAPRAQPIVSTLMLTVTEPVAGVVSVQNNLNVNLTSAFQNETLVAQDSQNVFQLMLVNSKLQGVWIDITFPKKVVTVSCTK